MDSDNPVITYLTGGEFGWAVQAFKDGKFGLAVVLRNKEQAPFVMSRDELADLRAIIDDALNTSEDEMGGNCHDV